MFPKVRFLQPSKRFYSDVLLVSFSAIVLCYMAFYNGFPFFFSDSGTYLWTAFGNFKPYDRPMLYGLFIRHTSLMTSLWLSVFAQALAVAIPLFFCFKYFSGTQKFRIYYIVYIFIITFFTGVSINVGQMIADIFTPVAILCLALLLFIPRYRTGETVTVSLLFILAVGVHNSHFIIIALILVILLLAFIFRNSRTALQRANVNLKRILYAFLLLVSSYLFDSTIHYNAGLKFSVSNNGHVFLMGKLFDCGILEQYLHDACPTHHYKICSYEHKFPWDFIWDYANSPLYKTGGWDANRDEYNAIIRDIITTPKYYPRLIAREAEATFRQFFTFNTGETGAQEDGSGSATLIRAHWYEYFKDFFQSRQQVKTLDWTMLNLFQTYLISFLFLCSMIAYFIPGFDPKYKMYLTFILIALLVNAFTCGAVSTVVDRYQSRVIWLLTLPFMLYIANNEFTLKPLKKFFTAPNRNGN